MSKPRIYEIAKTLGISNKEIINQLERMGIKNKKHSSSLDDVTAETILNFSNVNCEARSQSRSC